MIDLAAAMLLARQCAPSVAPRTMAALLLAEGGLDPLAIGDNAARKRFHPRDRLEAQATAEALIA